MKIPGLYRSALKPTCLSLCMLDGGSLSGTLRYLGELDIDTENVRNGEKNSTNFHIKLMLAFRPFEKLQYWLFDWILPWLLRSREKQTRTGTSENWNTGELENCAGSLKTDLLLLIAVQPVQTGKVSAFSRNKGDLFCSGQNIKIQSGVYRSICLFFADCDFWDLLSLWMSVCQAIL